MPEDRLLGAQTITKQLSRRVRQFIVQHRLISPGLLVVGVSGGADSVCLLHLLNRMKSEFGVELHVAHLNHGLRGAESEGDAEYVGHLAKQLGLEATIEKRDVKGYQERNRCSLEEAAREVRYAFLTEVAQSLGAKAIAVGHTADDQAETILMHLIRGTGLSGLRGMQPLSTWRSPTGTELTLLRPLLAVSREETNAYCAALNLPTRFDSSNILPSYLRNRIRSELIPLLQSYNPNIKSALIHTANIIAADLDYIMGQVSPLWGSVVHECPNGVTLDNEKFSSLPPALKHHLLRSVFEHLLGSLRDIESVHIESLIKLLAKPAGKKLSLPGGLTFYGSYTESLLTKEKDIPCPFPILEGEYKLTIPGETRFSNWLVKAELSEQPPKEDNKDGFKACFDFDLSGADLLVRRRKEGDRFQPLGMSQDKKLQDFMVDAKIPRGWRDRIPLVCSGERILWVVGWRISHRVRISPATKRILCLEFKKV